MRTLWTLTALEIRVRQQKQQATENTTGRCAYGLPLAEASHHLKRLPPSVWASSAPFPSITVEPPPACPPPAGGGYRQTQFVGPSGNVLRRIDKLTSRNVPGIFFDALDKFSSRNVPGMFFSKSQVQLKLFWECSSLESSRSKLIFSERSSSL